MKLKIFTLSYLLFLSVGRCCELIRSTGFICLAFSNVKVLATFLDNRTEKGNQFERNKKEKTRSDEKYKPRHDPFKDLLSTTILFIILFPILCIFNWLFIGYAFFNFSGVIVIIYLIYAIVKIISNPSNFLA